MSYVLLERLGEFRRASADLSIFPAWPVNSILRWRTLILVILPLSPVGKTMRWLGFPHLKYFLVIHLSKMVSLKIIPPILYNPGMSASHIQGGINLLHTVPKCEAIYYQLLEIRTGQNVHIRGRELLRLDAYSSKNHLDMFWDEIGCNSLVVDSVVTEK